MPIALLDSGSDVLSLARHRESPAESRCRYAYFGMEPLSPPNWPSAGESPGSCPP